MAAQYEQLKSLGTDVVVIGPGTAADAAKLKAQLNLPFPVLADPDKASYTAFQFGRAFLGLMQQNGTMIVDQDGTLRYELRANSPGGSLDLQAAKAALT